MSIDQQYAHMLETVFKHGVEYNDPNRQGVVRKEVPSYTFRHEFKDGFPAISTKKLFFKSVTTELIWFLRGDTNIKYLVDNGCNIWNKDAYKYYLAKLKRSKIGTKPLTFTVFLERIRAGGDYLIVNFVKPEEYTLGDLGPVYGHQWRNSNGIDQIQQLITNMIETPMSSELLVNSWIPTDIKSMALPPCHYGFQIVMIPLNFECIVDYTGLSEDAWFKIACQDLQHLDIVKYYNKYYQLFFGPEHDSCEEYIPKYGFELHWNQRSCDLFLGVPFNIASYAELALILEKATGYPALAIQGDLKKVHLYSNSFEAAREQLSRTCSTERVLLQGYPLTESFDEFDIHGGNTVFTVDHMVEMLDNIKSDLILINYNPQPALQVEMLERDE